MVSCDIENYHPDQTQVKPLTFLLVCHMSFKEIAMWTAIEMSAWNLEETQ